MNDQICSEKPSVSVIVPVYKAEKYLHRCIGSILNQTYRDFELILIDDGSPDKCGLICDEFAERDSRIRVFHQENRGVASARNAGLEKAEGKYISFVDSDDWIENDFLEKEIAFIEKTGLKMVKCGITREYSDRSRVLFVREEDTIISAHEGVSQLSDYARGKIENICNAVWGAVYSREIFDTIRFPEGRIYEDVAVSCRLLYSAGRIGILSGGPYYHSDRRNLDSIEHTMNMKRFIDYWSAMNGRLNEFSGIFPDLKDKMVRGCFQAVRKIWIYGYACYDEAYLTELQEISTFIRANAGAAGKESFKMRAVLRLAGFPNKWSMWMVQFSKKLLRRIKKYRTKAAALLRRLFDKKNTG